ncbi:MAG: hypothetical protein H0X73_15290 [Chthoniobacterales bacterium]|nr:hypothetical protein [Chthoniobacterales bacterium]
MKSKSLLLHRGLTALATAACGVLLLFSAGLAARADALSDLASFSMFEKIDLAQLAIGDAKTVRGPAMSASRFLSVQTCWVAPGSPADVAAALRNWNPAQHAELKIILHANGSDFERLQQAPDNGVVRALVAATVSKSTALQISRDEAAKLPSGGSAMAGPVANFWAAVLSARSAAGPFGQAPYDFTGQAIRAGDEINGLLRQQPKIQKQFAGIIAGKGDRYWELVDIENKGVLTLGASYGRSSGNGQQAADVLYYASGGFYAGLTLYQMWPVDLDGRSSTLVWRGDMTSAAEIGETRGMERLGAESAMIKDVSRAVRLFRRDTGGGR